MSEGIQFYRCELCHGVVSLWDIHGEPHSCPKCAGVRIRPSGLSAWEKFVQIVKHPRVWAWESEIAGLQARDG